MTSGPRLRFAPSPTGYFHVGGGRTALYNWLLARQQDGVFILRVEDTDTERNRQEWIQAHQDALRWLGIDWDEGPFLQSERSELYAEAASKLFADGQAYYCDCTREQVEERTKGNATPGYDGHCRDRDLEPAPGRVLRFKTPKTGSLHRVDLIRGTTDIECSTIEDFVVVRGNGTAMFLLANTVDDIDMRITHVVRGEEHLSNVPKGMLLWDALGGGQQPIYAHLPILVNEKRQKISKRRGDRVAVEDYRDLGYLSEAFVNYLCLLGWSPKGDREIITREEMIAEFRLEDVVPSPAFFDEKKLTHFNGEYIRALGNDEFIDRVFAFMRSRVLDTMGGLVQERVSTLREAPAMIDFFFIDAPPIEAATWDKVMAKPQVAELLDGAIAAYTDCDWTSTVLHETTLAVGEALGLKLNKAQAPIRVAVTGRQVGPPLFESLQVLGRDRTLARLQAVRARLT